MLTPLDLPTIAAALAGRADTSPDLPSPALPSPALLGMLARFERVFALHSPAASGLTIVGGTIRARSPDGLPASMAHSVTGNGWKLANALVSLLGEGAELLAQFAMAGDIAANIDAPLLNTGWIKDLAAAAHDPGDTVVCRAINSDAVWRVPAGIALRQHGPHSSAPVAGPLGSGVAAGATHARARQRAVLELVERDAAALWWFGGRPGQMLHHRWQAATAHALGRLRQGTNLRTTRLLDLTTDLGIPVVAACSFDTEGRDLAVGIASRMRMTEAIDAALRELGQMELSATIARLKRAEGGEAALNGADRKHLDRADFHAADCALLQPADPAATSKPASLHWSEVGTAVGQPLVLLNLTRRWLGVPVIRALCPGLQPFTTTVTTERMTAAIGKHGGGAQHHGGSILPF